MATPRSSASTPRVRVGVLRRLLSHSSSTPRGGVRTTRSAKSPTSFFGGRKSFKRRTKSVDDPADEVDETQFFAFDEVHCSPKAHTPEKCRTSRLASNPIARFQRQLDEQLTPISRVLYKEMVRQDKSVGKAVLEQYESLRNGGRLFEIFFESRKLGFTLVLARFSHSPRARLIVEETLTCPDTIRPLDELVAINGSLLIPIDMEAFPALVSHLVNMPRPLTLTFAKTRRRAKAFQRQALAPAPPQEPPREVVNIEVIHADHEQSASRNRENSYFAVVNTSAVTSLDSPTSSSSSSSSSDGSSRALTTSVTTAASPASSIFERPSSASYANDQAKNSLPTIESPRSTWQNLLLAGEKTERVHDAHLSPVAAIPEDGKPHPTVIPLNSYRLPTTPELKIGKLCDVDELSESNVSPLTTPRTEVDPVRLTSSSAVPNTNFKPKKVYLKHYDDSDQSCSCMCFDTTTDSSVDAFQDCYAHDAM